MEVIPNIYEAYRAQSLVDKQIAVQKIFPSSQTRALTQIAYFLRKQTEVNENIVERSREQRFKALAMADLMFGQTLTKNAKKFIRYKFVLPNSLGFPVIGISSDIRSINNEISATLGVLKYTQIGGMPEIQAGEVPLEYTAKNQVTNTVIRKNKDGFDVKIYITKFLR